jgi:hypothetical protein
MNRFFIDEKGYPRWNDTHILVHRSIAKNLLGMPIPPGMVVHHIDGNKRNFRKTNLAIMTRAAHFRLHVKGLLGGVKVSKFF